jgi:hypothetical protein
MPNWLVSLQRMWVLMVNQRWLMMVVATRLLSRSKKFTVGILWCAVTGLGALGTDSYLTSGSRLGDAMAYARTRALTLQVHADNAVYDLRKLLGASA